MIEEAGHLFICLPKFHCELNFIECFRGAVKWHLQENWDYTFTTLQENVPKALESVSVETIQKWEHLSDVASGRCMMVQWVLATHDFVSRSSARKNTSPVGGYRKVRRLSSAGDYLISAHHI